MILRRIYDSWISPQRWLQRAGVRPPMQVVFGVVLLTSCVLMFAKALQLVPSEDDATVRARTMLVEMVASRVGTQISSGDLDGVNQYLKQLIQRQNDVLSVGLRRLDHKILVETANHETYWRREESNLNTPTHIQVLLYDNQTPWATLEIAFKALPSDASWSAWWSSGNVRLAVFILGSCFVLYWFYFSRMLRMLDPSAAVPERLQLVMDTLVEGVAILDNDDRIVLANQSFARMAFLQTDRLIGQTLSSLPWVGHDGPQPPAVYPWHAVKESNLPQRGVPVRFQIGAHYTRSLNVNASPILDPTGMRRGVLVTFDDQTVIETDNAQLANLISKLADAGEDIDWFREHLSSQEDKDHLAALEQLAAAAREIAKSSTSALEDLAAPTHPIGSPATQDGGIARKSDNDPRNPFPTLNSSRTERDDR